MEQRRLLSANDANPKAASFIGETSVPSIADKKSTIWTHTNQYLLVATFSQVASLHILQVMRKSIKHETLFALCRPLVYDLRI